MVEAMSARRRLQRLFSGSDPDRFDGVSGDALVETARDGFDFGEFGHVVRIQDAGREEIRCSVSF
jgi:hypothetical protein